MLVNELEICFSIHLAQKPASERERELQQRRCSNLATASCTRNAMSALKPFETVWVNYAAELGSALCMWQSRNAKQQSTKIANNFPVFFSLSHFKSQLGKKVSTAPRCATKRVERRNLFHRSPMSQSMIQQLFIKHQTSCIRDLQNARHVIIKT